jgi:hypothetical protein
MAVNQTTKAMDALRHCQMDKENLSSTWKPNTTYD